MIKNNYNNTGKYPNYLNSSTTSCETTFSEISTVEGNLSEELKNHLMVFDEKVYIEDNTKIYSNTYYLIEEGKIE